ncbi:DUF4367 domain-containing protein [Desulforamulus ferrireducens]|uniref:DUF4367 domain-containing protein n=1 Tax=Desulforamulus ferrireducens TaxID=1833852 RepID=A0A1S6IZD4_9FIRM|nr:DUF4367 domain-containing protein [Desulforamulus ferrireducens]AQS60134.1 hypothetical protein B0537_14245 [Desulforamulus ferrireducens]
MSEKQYSTIDELIKRNLKQKAEQEQEINIEEAWERFAKRYPVRSKQKSYKILGIASFLFLIVTISFSINPTEGSAVNLRFFESIKSFISGKVQTAHISFGNKEKNAADYISPEVYSVLKDITYEILLPLDMMDIYNLDKAEINRIGDSKQIDLIFRDMNNNLITMTQINIIGDINLGNSFDTEDANMKKVKVKGQEANLIVYKNGFAKLSWIDRNIFITIAGEISEDNILILANSTKRVNL